MALRPNSFDDRKALEAVLFVVSRLPDPTFHSVSKVLYFADRSHLERYGRLIFGGHYVAMKWGPVQSQTYDMMKAAAGLQGYARLDVSEALSAQGYILRPMRAARDELLSDSERSCLTEAIDKMAPLDFNQRTKKTHDSVWEAASENGVITAEDIAQHLQDSKSLVDYLRS